MWIALLEDGNDINGQMIYWTDLKKKNISLRKLGLSHQILGNINLAPLENLNSYYYVKEALSYMEQPDKVIVDAEIIGGFDSNAMMWKEIRLDREGNVHFRVYPDKDYKYNREILISGIKTAVMEV